MRRFPLFLVLLIAALVYVAPVYAVGSGGGLPILCSPGLPRASCCTCLDSCYVECNNAFFDCWKGYGCPSSNPACNGFLFDVCIEEATTCDHTCQNRCGCRTY